MSIQDRDESGMIQLFGRTSQYFYQSPTQKIIILYIHKLILLVLILIATLNFCYTLRVVFSSIEHGNSS